MSEFFESFRFASPWWFLCLLALPLLALLDRRQGTAGAVTLPSLSVLLSLGQKPQRRLGSLSGWLMLLALLTAITALARPQTIEKHTIRSASGIDIMLTIDVSLSMEMDDMVIQRRRAQRITAAKLVASDFIKRRPDDRIGITAFGGQPYYVSPLTLDHNWLQQALKDIRLGEIQDTSTAIGSAIAASSIALSHRESKSKIIVLVTDGKNTAGKIPPIDAASEAVSLGIKIYTIAIGTEDGRLRNASVGQQFDVPTLKSIAKITGGEFYWAKTTETLVDVFKSIDKLEKTEVDSSTAVIPTEIFHWFLIGSAIFTLTSVSLLIFNPPPAP